MAGDELSRVRRRDGRGRLSTRRLALVVGVAGLAVAAVFVVLAWVATARTDLLLGAASAGVGRRIEIAGARLSVLGGLGVALRDVRIAEDPAFGSEPFLTARALEMRLRLWPLLRRQVVVDDVLIDQPTVSVVRNQAGRLNVDTLGGRVPRSDPTSGDGRSTRPPPFQLANLRLRNGTIRYRELATGRTVELAAVGADARQPTFGGSMPVAFRARLVTEDVRMENVHGEGTLDMGASVPVYRGTVEAGPGMLGQLPIARLAAGIVVRPPVVDLDGATAELLDGKVTGNAHLASAGESAGLAARLDGKGFALERLPAPAGRPHPAGTLSLQGDASGPPPGTPDFQKRLGGSGRFEVADARLSGIPIGRALNDVLAPFLRPEEVARLRTRYPDLFTGDDLRFTRLSGSGRLAGGVIRSDDLVLAAPSYEGRGAGTLDLDGRVDVAIQLATSPALTDDIFGKSKARAVLVDERGRLTIPLRVHGPLEHPRVTPDAAFVGNVARALLSGSGLGDVAGSVLEQLLQKRRKGH